MKTFIFVALFALAACCNKNYFPVLQHEAVTLAKYYQPKLDAIDARITAIMKRGEKIPGDLPGIKEVGGKLKDARDEAVKLRGIVGSSGQKSAVETQADAAAKDGKLANLQKLVHDTEGTLTEGITLITTNLDAVETWLYHYDHNTLAMAAPQKAEQPGQAEAVSTPATGQPPAAAQGSAAQGSGAPAPAGQIK